MDTGESFSPQAWFERLAQSHTPRYSFKADGDFESWKAEAKPAVLATLGRLPEPVDPEPRLIGTYEHDDVFSQRWVVNLGNGLSAILVINLPSSPETCSNRPGILCWAGHSVGGKESMMGNRSSPALRQVEDQIGPGYGLALAQAGFVTFAIDWMGKGDLDEDRYLSFGLDVGGRDWCNIYYLHATLLGMTPLGINVTHGSRMIDVVASFGYVDPYRVGVMGLSGGGTHALWTSLVDDRIKASEIICYSDSFARFAVAELNACGSQITPGLFDLVDISDMQGLVAPKPLMLDVAVYDTCFFFDAASACVERARAVYAAAGCSDVFASQQFQTEHGWEDRGSRDFFRRHLGDPDAGATPGTWSRW